MRHWLLPPLALICAPALQAQTLPSFFNSNDVERRLPAPNLPVDSYRPQQEASELPEPGQAQQVFMSTEVAIAQVRIEGGSVYPFEELAAVYQPLIGSQATLAQLIEVTRSITARYQADGYPLSYAFLPDQRFEDGLVRVVLVEGYIAEYQIVGDVGPARAKLDAIARRLLQERPLKRETFERYSALLGSIPGITTQVQVPPPGTTDGATGMLIQAAKKTIQSSMNLTTSSRDDAQALFTVNSNSLTSLGEQLSFSALLPPGEDKEHYYRLDYNQMLGSNGTLLNLSASSYEAQPREGIPLDGGLELTQKRDNDRYSLAVTHPLISTSSQLWNLGARLYAVNDRSRFQVKGTGVGFQSQTRTRALGLESDWRQNSSTRLRLLSAGLYQGFNGMGAETDAATTDVDFLRVRLSGVQSDNYTAKLQGVVSAALYWSDDSLPDSEQAIFGGQNFGRGYPSDQASGDRGWGLAYELNYSISREGSWVRLLQPYVAVDTARTSFNQSQLRDSHLSSAAIGLRFGDARYYNIALETAKPMSDRALDSNNRKPRYTLSFSYQL